MGLHYFGILQYCRSLLSVVHNGGQNLLVSGSLPENYSNNMTIIIAVILGPGLVVRKLINAPFHN